MPIVPEFFHHAKGIVCAAELLRVGLQHAALLAPYAQAFFGRRGPGLVLAWPFRYAWYEGYGGLLGLSLLGLAGLGLLYGGALAGMLCLLDARRMLRFPVALAILLAFGGLAMALEGWLIRWHLERGWTPFCHVYEDNPASHALQKKLGLTPAPEQVVWLHRPHGEDEE